MIETLSQTFAAGEVKTFLVQGDYFELIDAPSSTVDVILSDRSGAQLSRMIGAEASFYNAPGRFEMVQITSQAAQTVKFFIADGTAGTRRTSGVIRLADQLNTFVGAQATVTNASAQIAPANAARRYLLIQNNHPTGSIYIAFGVAATLTAGIKIAPGGFYEMTGPVSTQEIRAIGDIASNTNVVEVGA